MTVVGQLAVRQLSDAPVGSTRPGDETWTPPFPLVAGRLLRRSVLRAVHNGNVEQVSSWLRASHPLQVALSREFAAERKRTADEPTEAAARGVVVVRLHGARQADR